MIRTGGSGETLDEIYEDSLTAELVDQRRINESIHNHTTYSDGNNAIHDMVMEAASLGIQYLGFADHWDVTGSLGRNYNDFCTDEPFDAAYENRRESLHGYIENESEDGLVLDEAFPVHIADGAELDYHPDKEDELEYAVENADFDYILLSVHYDQDGNDYRGLNPADIRKEADEVVDDYFNNIQNAAEFADRMEDIKVISHPDRIETNPHLNDSVEMHHYDTMFDHMSNQDVLPESNGKVQVRHGNTLLYEMLCERDVPYSVGTDTHRVGAVDRVDWDNETQKRLNVLEDNIDEIGRRPEPVIQELDLPAVKISFSSIKNSSITPSV